LRGITFARGLLGGERLGKGKGCDIGYALAGRPREEAKSVDTRTVTAFWCDHYFRSPKFQLLRAESSVFGCSASYPAKLITQPTLDRQNFT